MRAGPDRRRILFPLVLLVLWTAAAVWLEYHHAFWRDEVRALSIALQGDDVFEMLRLLRGEGHPALWYLILRGLYSLCGSMMVLPFASVFIGFLAAALLLYRSPFPPLLSLIILSTGFFLGEYTISARNYGISAVLLFVLASLYSAHQRRPLVFGSLLFLLANTNAHSVLLVLAFLLFWLVDLKNVGEGRRHAFRGWCLASLIALAGIGCCAITVYPPQHDAVTVERETLTRRQIVDAVVLPASTFGEMIYQPARALGVGTVSTSPVSKSRIGMSLLLFASTLGLLGRAGALIAGLTSLIGFSVFFAVIYPGGYRHEGLWFVFLTTLYWIDAKRSDFRALPRQGAWGAGLILTGRACFAGIALLQIPVSYDDVRAVLGGVPKSQVRNLAAVLNGREDLASAIVLPEPDYLVEALPYYAPNPIYLPRSGTFAKFTYFKKEGTLALSLTDVLAAADTLCRAHAVPVVMVIQQDLATLRSERRFREGYNWTLSVTPSEVSALTSSTEFLGRFQPALTDEVFSAYALHPPCLPSLPHR